MPNDEHTLPIGDSSSDIFGQTSADHGRSWPLPDSAIGLESAAPGKAGDGKGSGVAAESQEGSAPGDLSPSFLDWAGASASGSPAVDPSAETVADDAPAIAFSAAGRAAAPQDSAAPASATSERRHSLLVIGLISYSSAATLALLYLLFALSRPRPHALESLPDVPPLDVQHGEVMKLAPADAELPPGHELALGESRRFGNLLVEPLRVEAGPIVFEHFSGRALSGKPPTPPVLKLWVRFTNVSKQQTIAPLDAELLYRRTTLDDGHPRANQFVGRTSERDSPDALVLMYDHPLTSEWDLGGQQLGRSLAPGESLETYLPSGEDGASLSGPLVWRMHFRKGYSPHGFGVTTLVEVLFDSAEIQSGAAADQPAAG